MFIYVLGTSETCPRGGGALFSDKSTEGEGAGYFPEPGRALYPPPAPVKNEPPLTAQNSKYHGVSFWWTYSIRISKYSEEFVNKTISPSKKQQESVYNIIVKRGKWCYLNDIRLYWCSCKLVFSLVSGKHYNGFKIIKLKIHANLIKIIIQFILIESTSHLTVEA